MLYLLDADVLITAHNTYYPIDKVPEYWAWLKYQGERGRLKIPHEIIEEILAGNEDDPLVKWMKNRENRKALELEESPEAALVQRVVAVGYASDLTDDEIEEIGRDPLLIAYALRADNCVVTREISKPSKKRQNRKIPDVCKDLSVQCCDPFDLNKALNFHTGWKPED